MEVHVQAYGRGQHPVPRWLAPSTTTSSSVLLGSVTPGTVTPGTVTPTMDFPIATTTKHPMYKFIDALDICGPAVFQEQPLESTLAILYMAIGIFYVTLGYRGFKFTMFAMGYAFSRNIVYAICNSDNYLPFYANIAVSTSAGFLFGLITMLIQYVGIFVSGLHHGVLQAALGLLIYTQLYIKESPNAYWTSTLILSVCGIVFACANIFWKKVLTIVSTSMVGGALIAMSLDYYLERMVAVKWAYERVKMEPTVPLPCRYSWIPLVIWPALAVFGIFVQSCFTGKGIHHEEGLATVKRRAKAAPVHLTREQRNEMRQRKYRYLYQVRTAHGDVISQSYVQALQQKTSSTDPWSAPGGESSTLQSDSTHLTVLASDAPQPDSDEDFNQIRVCH